MRAFGMAAIAAQTGRSLSIVYRWAKALEAGEGVRDVNKLALIRATAGSSHAIEMADFFELTS